MRICFTVLFLFPALLFSAASITTLRQDSETGKWELRFNGGPYAIKGAATIDHLPQLATAGGNSFRTWSVTQVEDGNLLNEALARNMTVAVGIWVQQSKYWDYNSPDRQADILAQRERIRQEVRRNKDHPALLMWCLGNEMEADATGTAIWKELNVLATIVKEEDPNHPVMTALSSASREKLDAIKNHYPNLDILGVNLYGGSALNSANTIPGHGWTKPFILTEYGHRGHWSFSPGSLTPWDAPPEPSSEEKADMYTQIYNALTNDESGQCLGSYAFKWGHVYGGTPTWYSLFLPTGEHTAIVDELTRLWTGAYPANRCPEIISWGTPGIKGASIPARYTNTLSIQASDPENDPLTITCWVITDDSKSTVIPNTIINTTATTAQFIAPVAPGNYRLYVKAVDSNGGASVRNIPFQVLAPDIASFTHEELLVYAFTDNYTISDNGTLMHDGTLSWLPWTELGPNGNLTTTVIPLRPRLVYEVQQSHDLQSWSTIQSIPGNASASPVPVEIEYTDGEKHQFLRVKVVPAQD